MVVIVKTITTINFCNYSFSPKGAGKTAREFAKSKGVSSTLTDKEVEVANSIDLQMSMKKINENYLKKTGIDAHEIKIDFVGNKNISKYDLYVETETGEIHIFLKGGKGEGIATGEYIK